MGEENWPGNVVRSRGKISFDDTPWADYLTEIPWDRDAIMIVFDGPRPALCADCGNPPEDGLLIHMKPEVYAVLYKGETFYLERHLCVSCAAKRGLV